MGTDGLWTCPRCGARFVTRNMSHGCGEFTVKGFLEGEPPRLRALYDAFGGAVSELGPFEQVPTKTRGASWCGCDSRRRTAYGRTVSCATCG